MKLSHADLEKLYSEPSGAEPPAADEHNAEYAAKLRTLAQRIGLPSGYVASIG